MGGDARRSGGGLNEDRCCINDWVSEGRNESREDILQFARGWAVIADGMGGHDAGELASEFAIGTIREMISQAGSESAILQGARPSQRAHG